MNVTPRQHAPTPSGVTHANVTKATEGPVEHVLVRHGPTSRVKNIVTLTFFIERVKCCSIQ